MPQNAPQNTKFSWGSMPPDPPTVNDCKAAMFSTSANDMAPQMEKVMYGPVVRFGSLRRVSQVTLVQGNVWKEIPDSMNLEFT